MHRCSFGTRVTAVFTALAFSMALLGPAPARAAGKLKIMTATTDLAALAEEVGGEKIEVGIDRAWLPGPTFVDAKPSFLLKLKRADLLIVVGLELEIGWLPPLINQSTNPKIQVAAPGYLDASRFAKILEIPTGQVTRAEGDVHPLGNPHYWLDPENGLRIAKGIADKLAEMRPEDAAYFAQRYADFEQRLKQADERWLAEMKPYAGRKIVTYHRSWPNFAEHFHLNVAGYVEPRPGIPPSPQHTRRVDATDEARKRKGDRSGTLFRFEDTHAVARETGGQVLVLPPSVGGEKEITDYFKLFDYDIRKLRQAFDATP